MWFMLARVMNAVARIASKGTGSGNAATRWSTLLGICLVLCLQFAAAAEPAGLLRDFAREQLLISTAAKGCTLVDVYVAGTAQQRAQGLMHVRTLGSHEGMVFVYPRRDVIQMWMKNTWLPLDMLFADSEGRIVHMHRNARPHDETIISSRKPVAYVVELNAGSIDRFGITTDDRIEFPAP